jgi:hypothetical protein
MIDPIPTLDPHAAGYLLRLNLVRPSPKKSQWGPHGAMETLGSLTLPGLGFSYRSC